MTYKDIYRDLKNGFSFTNGMKSIFIGYCDNFNSPSYGKEYIYYSNYGSSAKTVSYRNLCWIISEIFEMRANEFYKTFTMQ